MDGVVRIAVIDVTNTNWHVPAMNGPSRTAALAKAIPQLELLQCAISGTSNWKNQCPLSAPLLTLAVY
jgi:acetolactate synthase small subunit